ncbi:hypothetical protein ABEF95_016908 [Exophiala dermatitidis]
MSLPSESTASDINLISKFLSCQTVPSLLSSQPVDVLVFCATAVLPVADNVFSALGSRPALAKTLVLCGGIGHSTELLYESIRKSKRYVFLAEKVQGLPEADVLNVILQQCYPKLVEQIRSNALKLLIENKSTNCGANAVETRRVLESHSVPTPSSVIIVQDATMSLRTLASFQHVYANVLPQPEFLTCPTFVPTMSASPLNSDEGDSPGLHFDVPGIDESDLWDHQRFFDLIMGEIPRLRDDENGYGPNGKGYIAHVDIPPQVEAAWSRLRLVLDSNR